MKVEKLLTLSQFVDYALVNIPEGEDIVHVIFKYNDFLKQSMNEGMFTGEDAIFDDSNVYLDKDYSCCVCILNGGVIPFGWTLHDLAVASRVKLKLKNVNL